MEPARYRRGAVAAAIRYTCADSPLGRMLIAATDKGICSIQFADSEEELEQAEDLFRTLNLAARKSKGSDPELNAPIAVEAGEHESDF